MGTHAYLILAHKNWNQLQKLIELLDDKRNDIFIHIDKKSSFTEVDRAIIEKASLSSKVIFINRIPVIWGDFSVVEAEMQLLKAAIKGNYQYYHLLSGMDLPLRTQDEIHAFFENCNGKNFIHYCDEEWTRKTSMRVQFYWMLQKMCGVKREKFWLFKLQRVLVELQKMVGINRCKDYNPKTGSQWWSITDELARCLCENKEIIPRWFSWTFCADEWVVQSLASQFGYEDSYYSNIPVDTKESTMRLIDWKRGSPYVFRLPDYDELINTECLFARKFDDQVDKEIILKIYEHVKKDT